MDDLIRIREALRVARGQAPVERDGVLHIGMTLDEAERISGLNRSTIHSIENVRRKPDLKVRLETITTLAHTYGLALTVSHAGMPVASALSANNPVPPVLPEMSPADDEELPPEEKERIYALGKAVYDAVRQAQGGRRTHRGSAPGPRHPEPEDGVHTGSTRTGPSGPKPRRPQRKRRLGSK